MNASTIRDLEIASIREYVAKHSGYLKGRVLDFGAGKPGTCREPQPYRDLVCGEYVPFDKGDKWPDGEFDAVLMTQVIQYIYDPEITLFDCWHALREGGTLVMTGPTNWAEVEPTDLLRYTCAGARRLLEENSFRVLEVKSRAEIDIGGFVMSLGWGAVAVKQ